MLILRLHSQVTQLFSEGRRIMYKDILSKLTNGVDLNAEEVAEIISDIREDKLTEGQIS